MCFSTGTQLSTASLSLASFPMCTYREIHNKKYIYINYTGPHTTLTNTSKIQFNVIYSLYETIQFLSEKSTSVFVDFDFCCISLTQAKTHKEETREADVFVCIKLKSFIEV